MSIVPFNARRCKHRAKVRIHAVIKVLLKIVVNSNYFIVCFGVQFLFVYLSVFVSVTLASFLVSRLFLSYYGIIRLGRRRPVRRTVRGPFTAIRTSFK